MSTFDRAIPDPAYLARMMAQLDIPMDEHESMIEVIDSVRCERFMAEVEKNATLREEWERFLFSDRNDASDDF